MGRRVAERFAIEALVARGGMGAVYRAHDERTGQAVALKVMGASNTDLRRFEREAALLAEVNHPTIVRYVAHGRLDEDSLFLAMEWLDGTSLAQRLVQGPLSVGATIALARRLADGLMGLHDLGIVHRDIKPDNLILVGGEPRQLKLVDLGVARRAASETVVTQTGAMVGTVGYMAPEQARGEREIDGRVDLFAMGCALFECLTGQAPFAATHAIARLARILLDEVPSLRSRRDDIPPLLQKLVASLLAKDPNERPDDAKAVLSVLAKLKDYEVADSDSHEPAASSLPPAPSLQSSELRITTILFVEAPANPAEHEAVDVSSGVNAGADELISAAGGSVTRLADGATVVTFLHDAAPADRAARAARCALGLEEHFPHRSIVLASGRAEHTAHAALALALDKGGELLESVRDGGGVVLDELTAGLLGGRFALDKQALGWRLVAERSTAEAPAIRRSLLGREIGYVGRRKELGWLAASFEETLEDRVVRVNLVMGAPGIGKSRLAAEFEGRIEERAAMRLLARATPMTVNASGAMLRSLIRSAVGLHDAEDPASSWERMVRYVMGLEMDEPNRAAEILGEIAGAPSIAEPSVVLRAARQDPAVLRYWLAQIVPAWLQTQARRRPLIVLLEDVHWADAATITLLDAALAQVQDASLFVVALARPEVEERFRPFLPFVAVHTVSLYGLSSRASAEIVERALPNAPSAVRAEIVERADGNPFYIEELVRAVAAGRADLPDTVLAVVEAHLARLETESRRVLRAASVFGEVCRAEGVAALLGDYSSELARSMLDLLVTRELLERRSVEGPGSEEQNEAIDYVFRHALLRDAAYVMLPLEERSVAHGRVAVWLEKQGGAEPGLLAEHFDRAGDGSKASFYFAAAAEVACARGDIHLAIELSERGLALDPADSEKARLLSTMGVGFAYAARFDDAREAARAVIPLYEVGSRQWVITVAGLAFSCSMTGDFAGFGDAMRLLGEADEMLEACAASAAAFNTSLCAYAMGFGVDSARGSLASMVRMNEQLTGSDPIVRGWMWTGGALLDEHRDDPVAAQSSRQRAIEAFGEAGDPVGLSFGWAVWSLVTAELGFLSKAERGIAKVTRLLGQGGLDYARRYAEAAEALVLLRRDPDRAYAALRALLEDAPLDIRSYAACTYVDLALARRDFDAIRHMSELLQTGAIAAARVGPEVFSGLGALAKGEPAQALAHLERSEQVLTADILPGLATLLDRLRVAVYRATGALDRAQRAADRAKERLERIAVALPEEARSEFWEQGFGVPELLREID